MSSLCSSALVFGAQQICSLALVKLSISMKKQKFLILAKWRWSLKHALKQAWSFNYVCLAKH